MRYFQHWLGHVLKLQKKQTIQKTDQMTQPLVAALPAQQKDQHIIFFVRNG